MRRTAVTNPACEVEVFGTNSVYQAMIIYYRDYGKIVFKYIII